MKLSKSQEMISIIIPVFNAEKYLNKCIDSVLNQTYKNFELLLVNDGSNDSSGEICDYYVSRDERIKVFHQENKGVSKARNIGVENSRGTFITFIDSDDWVESNYLSSFMKEQESNGADLLIGGILKENEKGSYILYDIEEQTFFDENYNLLFDNYDIYKIGYTVAKLYKSNIIKNNNISFNDKISFTEDLLFMLEYIYYSEAVRFIPYHLYHYVSIDNGKSLSKKYYSFEEEFIAFDAFKRITSNLSRKFSLSRESLNKTNQNLAQKLFRTIYVLYRPSSRKDKSFRIKYLNDLASNGHKKYLVHLNGKDKLFINKFSLYILTRNAMKITDIIYYIMFNVRFFLENKYRLI